VENVRGPGVTNVQYASKQDITGLHVLRHPNKICINKILFAEMLALRVLYRVDICFQVGEATEILFAEKRFLHSSINKLVFAEIRLLHSYINKLVC